ncbi:MAG TPA: type III-A CRISPR-associated protein Csm2 [Symbiobacteriaceae bacterium]|nr:type III-A CRISPR-associated protein Csm2 [Symbiobacteriaceae bacterium]
MNEKRLDLPIGKGAPAPGGHGGGGGGGFRFDEVDVSEHETWIKGVQRLSAIDNKELVAHADALGLLLVRDLTTTKARSFLSRVNALRTRFAHGFDATEVPLLKVRLAYAAAREKRAVGPLAKVLLPAVDRIESAEDFRWFARFVEAIVAYHRFHGGKE